MLTDRYCSLCGGARTFEQVPCDDGHGVDCPELLCVDCGYVVVVGVVDDVAAPGAGTRSVA